MSVRDQMGKLILALDESADFSAYRKTGSREWIEDMRMLLEKKEKKRKKRRQARERPCEPGDTREKCRFYTYGRPWPYFGFLGHHHHHHNGAPPPPPPAPPPPPPANGGGGNGGSPPP